MTHFGANALLKEEQIMEPQIQTMLGKSKLILAIDPPKQVAKKILSEGKRLRKILVWHPGVLARFGIKEWSEELKDRKSTRLNSSHLVISYAVFCLKKKKTTRKQILQRI